MPLISALLLYTTLAFQSIILYSQFNICSPIVIVIFHHKESIPFQLTNKSICSSFSGRKIYLLFVLKTSFFSSGFSFSLAPGIL
jgi:hypothetical protein